MQRNYVADKIHIQAHIPRNIHKATQAAALILEMNQGDMLGELITFGLAWLNDKRNLNLHEWDDWYKFPSLSDIEKFREQFQSLARPLR